MKKKFTYYGKKSADAGGEEDRLRGREGQGVGQGGAEGGSRMNKK